ncbi:sulfate ABC transporter permease subunit CysT [Paenibacillus thiaminolyticus]|uniref:sulfate ABC transporter permease subunit CysT n=1 Tax=Paenibacillus thiaminolyticus TaxID=49283 RepID=UPI00116465A6|nr:sulfate ABC transporter permease subunit CysT [Paenibacillus thiaminolyticus]NGP58099.1 sulfate ABC transporter permease subunit CysT [Paenibacillus thiaminolyticus]WCR26768.1 sulfate ABC transporter permease subunit CysT [Paenibacillus thiaminolyticus]
MNGVLRHKGAIWGFRSTLLLYVFLLIVLPIGGIYVQSFSGGWQVFRESIAEPLAWHAVALTFRLALIATAINMIIGTMTAWVLHRYRFAGRAWLNSLVDLPFALPTAVGGLMILLLLGPGSLADRAAEAAGWRLVLAEPAIVVSMVFVTFPFVIRAVQPLLEEADRSEEEASYTLGASRLRTFVHVLLPQMLPGILSGAMLAFSRAMAEFGAVVLVAGNIPGKTLVASVYIFGEIESDNPQGAAVVSVLLLTISFLILWLAGMLQSRRVSS